MAGGDPALLQSVLGRFGIGTGTPVTNAAAPAAAPTPVQVPAPTIPPQTPAYAPNAPTIAPTGETAPTGLSPQALAQLSILQQMSFNPYSFYGA